MNIRIIEKKMEFARNILVSGKSKSGKTKNVIFPLVDNLIHNNENILIIDTKNEYLPQYSEVLNAKKYNVINLDFNNSKQTNKLNFFTISADYYKNDEQYLCIQSLRRIADIIITDSYNKDYTYAKNSFIGLILALYNEGQFELNLLDIKQIVSLNGNLLLNRILDKYKDDEKIYSYLENLYNDELRYKICTLLNNILGIYSTDELFSSLIIETNVELANAPIAIIVNSTNITKYTKNIINIYIEELYNYFKNKQNTLNIVIENYLDLNNSLDIDNMMLFSISNNIRFIISTNDIEEFKNIYGNFVIKTSDLVKITENTLEVIQDTESNKFDKELTFLNVDLCTNKDTLNSINRDEVSFDKLNVFNDVPSPDTITVDKLIEIIDQKLEEIDKIENNLEIKKPLQINDDDFVIDNPNPFEKINFDEETDLSINNKQEENNNPFEEIVIEYKMDNLENNEELENKLLDIVDEINKEENNYTTETDKENSEFQELINLIDQKILELDNDSNEDESDGSSEKEEPNNVFDFLM